MTEMDAPEVNATTIRLVFDAIADELVEMGRVEIDGFGVFELHVRKARRARNPRTNAPIDLPPTMAVRFRPAGALKARAAGRLPEA